MSVESKEKKTQIIEKLQDAFSRCSIGILTDYRGLTSSQMTMLRRKLRESGSEYKVVKNTLARLAAEWAGKDELVGSFEGPVAIALNFGDISAPARVLAAFIRDAKTDLTIRGGFLEDRLLTSEDVMTLATLPPREVLIAMVIGQIKSPVTALLGCLTNPISGFIGVLQARIKQLEGE